MLTRSAAALVLAAVAVGCSSSSPPVDRAELAARAARMSPSDPKLAALYTQSCKACHTIADSGAPLAGDASAWEPRWQKGIQTLVQSTVRGMGAMPPGGQCFACNAGDYEKLIRFMAGHES
jgi:cytochrome c5